MVQAVVFTWAVETDEKREGNPDQHLNILSKNVENVCEQKEIQLYDVHPGSASTPFADTTHSHHAWGH